MTIDDRDMVRRAVRELVDATPPVPPLEDLLAFRPARSGARHNGPLATAVSAVAAAALVVVGLVLVSRRDADRSASRSVPTTTAAAPTADEREARLLYPVGTSVVRVVQAATIPSVPTRILDTIVSPSGGVFVVGAMENFWGAPPADRETRQFNGNTVAVGNEDGTQAYTTSTACTLVAIGDRSPAPSPWAPEPLALLETLVVSGSAVSLRLPAGWSSLGAGPFNASYQLQFEASVAGVVRNAELYQMLDSSLGAVANMAASGRGTRAEVNGVPAWVFMQEGSIGVAWSAVGRAALLVVPGATADEALSLAGELVPGHGSEWRELLSKETLPPTSTTSVPQEPEGCAAHTLTWIPAP